MTPTSFRTGSDAAKGISFPAVDARTWTLPNGLGIIVQEDHSAPVASVQAWIETGSIHESAQPIGVLSCARNLLDRLGLRLGCPCPS